VSFFIQPRTWQTVQFSAQTKLAKKNKSGNAGRSPSHGGSSPVKLPRNSVVVQFEIKSLF
jgi:hypothetical protein